MDIFPGSAHVRDVGLARANDVAIWDYARDHDLTIVSKDADFHHLSFVYGPPPKVIWTRSGNCSTTDIAGLLRSNRIGILAFEAEMESAFLALFWENTVVVRSRQFQLQRYRAFATNPFVVTSPDVARPCHEMAVNLNLRKE